MAARAIWKGQIKIGTTKVPVKLYSAVQDRTVRFNILDDRNKMRVKQHMVDPDSGDEVPTEEIQKGYEIEEFVDQDEISQQWFERPYYLGPDNGAQEYFALAEALKNQEKEGVAHWVMRNKYYSGVLRSIEDYLYLFTLKDAKEVISAKDLAKPAGAAPTQKELAMAKQLVEMLRGEFNASDYKDEYRDRVEKFIAQKAKGRAPRLQAVKTKRKSDDLNAALEKSLAALKKGKRAA